MIKKILSTGLSVAVIGLGLGLAASFTTPANARDFSVHGSVNAKHGFVKGKSRHDYRGKRHKKMHHRICTPREAVSKAHNRGLHRVRLEHAGRHLVVVKGRSYRGKVRMAFHRDSSRCRVAWVQESRGRGHYGGHRNHRRW